MRFPDPILKCVVFLGRKLHRDTDSPTTWTGTGFLVGMAGPDRLHIFTYLVTAKHCAEGLAGSDWYVRLNKKGGGSIIVPGTPGVQWETHPTESDSVDAALIPWGPPSDGDVEYLPDTMFATDKVIADYRIGCGDEVAITGLFSKLTGTDRNHPIVRTGNIAMMPNEQLPAIKIGKYTGPASVYLIEARSIGGLSGSPVFVRQSLKLQTEIPERTSDGKLTGQNLAFYAQSSQVFFLGSMHGHWEIQPEDQNNVQIRAYRNERSVALGIAVVVPAEKILEILNKESFRNGRELMSRQWIESQGTTTETMA
jgi:hypothetical protein